MVETPCLTGDDRRRSSPVGACLGAGVCRGAGPGLARGGGDERASASWSAIRSSTTRRSSARWLSAATSPSSSPSPDREAGQAGFGVAFEWDVDLLAGYRALLTNVARQPSTDRFSGCDTPGIAGEIERGRFDAFVVPGWGLRAYLQAVRACRRARVPVMVRGDSQLPGQRSAAVRLAKALLYRRMMRRFDGYLYVGQRSREYFEHYGAPKARLFFAPHCIDNQAFAGARPAHRAPDGRRRLLFVGKLIERKRPLDLVRAAALLQSRGAKVEVAFAGSGELEADSGDPGGRLPPCSRLRQLVRCRRPMLQRTCSRVGARET